MNLDEAHALLDDYNSPRMQGFPWPEDHQKLIDEAAEIVTAARMRLAETVERVRSGRGASVERVRERST